VSDLADALREAGHEDVAVLERKELAGRLRQSGRDDFADALEAGEPTPRVEGRSRAASRRRMKGLPGRCVMLRADG
jgi:hypothetical protein